MDKINRFVIVDKSTDKSKVKEQIDRDSTQDHVPNIFLWTEKLFIHKRMLKDWKTSIINQNANPDNNATYKPTKLLHLSGS